jgi:hypothetical protein
MLKMKKTLGILLAVCFLMSITVATVGASTVSIPKEVKGNSLVKGENVYIKNLVVEKKLIIIKINNVHHHLKHAHHHFPKIAAAGLNNPSTATNTTATNTTVCT